MKANLCPLNTPCVLKPFITVGAFKSNITQLEPGSTEFPHQPRTLFSRTYYNDKKETKNDSLFVIRKYYTYDLYCMLEKVGYFFRKFWLRAGDGNRFVRNATRNKAEIADRTAIQIWRKSRPALAIEAASCVHAVCRRRVTLTSRTLVHVFAFGNI